MKIQEVIVVEGHHDTATLKQYFDCDTIETGGAFLSQETIAFIQEVAKQRGIIVFTDPDHAGNTIRQKIQQAVPDAKHAFIAKDKAKTAKKVGVEHANKKDLQEALMHLMTFKDADMKITMQDLIELGLTSAPNSEKKRDKITDAWHLGKCNSKAFLKRINMLGKERKDLEAML